MHTLVVGGTGILRPAAEELARRGHTVTVVARHPVDETPQIFAASVDVRSTRALKATLDDAIAARGPFGLGLVYAPFAPASSMEAIAKRSSDRLIYVLTSQWAAPNADRTERDGWAPDGACGRHLTQHIILGWKYGTEGPRWHTPEEVSFGVLAAIEHGSHETTLGTLRPWSERPSA